MQRRGAGDRYRGAVVPAYAWSLRRVALVLAALSIFVASMMVAGLLGTDDGGDLRDPVTNDVSIVAVALAFAMIAAGMFAACGAVVLAARLIGRLAARPRD